jgi:hypothetical protein
LGFAFEGACNEPAPPASVKAPEPTNPVVAADAGAKNPRGNPWAGAMKAVLALPPPGQLIPADPDAGSMEDLDRLTRKEAADALAIEEHDRPLKYDRGKLALHTQVFAFITKTRAAWDALEPKLGADKAKAKAAVEKLAGGQRAGIVAMGKKMATIDPKGGNSNVTTDYDVMLNALANDYPEALVASLDGDPKPLAEQKAELDKRAQKISDWLAELKKK